jgi:2-polyprenyl-3-methyl-5-hydroxy-6-metoxy-1,4-benzoquinol methylase
MSKAESKNVYKTYDKIAHWYAQNRTSKLLEKGYLDQLIELIPDNGNVLDIGCGTGKPILEYLQSKKLRVTGLDASTKILDIAKANFPETDFILQDMRQLSLERKFDAIIAWNSFFHLPAEDQPAMFSLFEKHLHPKGVLLFTTGTERGEAWGINGGENIFHASLDLDDYRYLLTKHRFKIIENKVNDPNCGGLTIWLAQHFFNA